MKHHDFSYLTVIDFTSDWHVDRSPLFRFYPSLFFLFPNTGRFLLTTPTLPFLLRLYLTLTPPLLAWPRPSRWRWCPRPWSGVSWTSRANSSSPTSSPLTRRCSRDRRTFSRLVHTNVADPDPSDPYVFGPLGSGSISQRNGSGSFYHQAKKVTKTLIPTVLWLLLTVYLWKMM